MAELQASFRNVFKLIFIKYAILVPTDIFNLDQVTSTFLGFQNRVKRLFACALLVSVSSARLVHASQTGAKRYIFTREKLVIKL